MNKHNVTKCEILSTNIWCQFVTHYHIHVAHLLSTNVKMNTHTPKLPHLHLSPYSRPAITHNLRFTHSDPTPHCYHSLTTWNSLTQTLLISIIHSQPEIHSLKPYTSLLPFTYNQRFSLRPHNSFIPRSSPTITLQLLLYSYWSFITNYLFRANDCTTRSSHHYANFFISIYHTWDNFEARHQYLNKNL